MPAWSATVQVKVKGTHRRKLAGAMTATVKTAAMPLGSWMVHMYRWTSGPPNTTLVARQCKVGSPRPLHRVPHAKHAARLPDRDAVTCRPNKHGRRRLRCRCTCKGQRRHVRLLVLLPHWRPLRERLCSVRGLPRSAAELMRIMLLPVLLQGQMQGQLASRSAGPRCSIRLWQRQSPGHVGWWVRQVGRRRHAGERRQLLHWLLEWRWIGPARRRQRMGHGPTRRTPGHAILPGRPSLQRGGANRHG